MGLGVLAYAGSRLGFGLAEYSVFLGVWWMAALILYSLWSILGTTSIWSVKIYNVTEVLRSLLEAGRYPIQAYPAAYRFLFTFVVPVVFLTTVPAELALGRGGFFLPRMLLLALGLFVFARSFWFFALRSYPSASS